MADGAGCFSPGGLLVCVGEGRYRDILRSFMGG